MTNASQAAPAANSDHLDCRSRSAGSRLRGPYLIYFGDVALPGYAKTGLGLVHWRRELCAGQMRLAGCQIDSGLPEMTFEDALGAGVRSVVIGVAPAGGRIPEQWMCDLVAAVTAGFDIVSGMHTSLTGFKALTDAAAISGSRLIDLRKPPDDIPVGTGEKRSGLRLLTVGSDCAVGKKYTALAIEKEMREQGWKADFRATGQTGVLIAGSGFPIDCVIGDFISGAAELIAPANEADHWDVIEGQGALAHPSYAGVSLGLLHGSQPDALVLCHDPSRQCHLGTEKAQPYALLTIRETMELNLAMARRTNAAARFVGVSMNTSGMTSVERAALFERVEAETGLPVVDPIVDSARKIVDRIQKEFGV